MNDLRSQLSPSWSLVNIALTVVLFLIAWPLGLLMVAYVVFGAKIGIDLAHPGSLSTFWTRIKQSWRAARASFSSTAALVSTPASTNPVSNAGTTPETGIPSSSGDASDRNGAASDSQTSDTRESEFTDRRETID